MPPCPQAPRGLRAHTIAHAQTSKQLLRDKQLMLLAGHWYALLSCSCTVRAAPNAELMWPQAHEDVQLRASDLAKAVVRELLTDETTRESVQTYLQSLLADEQVQTSLSRLLTRLLEDPSTLVGITAFDDLIGVLTVTLCGYRLRCPMPPHSCWTTSCQTHLRAPKSSNCFHLRCSMRRLSRRCVCLTGVRPCRARASHSQRAGARLGGVAHRTATRA